MTDYRERIIFKIMELSKREEKKTTRAELSHLNFEELKLLLEEMEREI